MPVSARAAAELPQAPSVDQVMVEERAASFAKRSIKAGAKLQGLKLAVAMMDLTTLEGKDTPGKVAYLCRKALRPIARTSSSAKRTALPASEKSIASCFPSVSATPIR